MMNMYTAKGRLDANALLKRLVAVGWLGLAPATREIICGERT